MKQISYFLIAFSFLIAPLLQSCNDDNVDSVYQAISTIRVINESEYFFISDSDSLYPKETMAPAYKAKDGQRAIVQFSFIDSSTSIYDADIKVLAIENILTKSVTELTEENKDEIGHDSVVPYYISLSKDGFLNIGSYIPIAQDIVLLSLVKNTLIEAVDEEYIYLEFRINDHNAPKISQLGRSFVSYKLGIYNPSETGKSIKLKVMTNEGEKEYIIDKNKNNSANQIYLEN